MSAQADTDIKAIDINFSGLNDSDNDEQGINDLYRSSFSMAIQFEGGEKSNKKTLFEDALTYSKYYLYYKTQNCIYDNEIMDNEIDNEIMDLLVSKKVDLLATNETNINVSIVKKDINEIEI
jgi:hypothetical protein